MRDLTGNNNEDRQETGLILTRHAAEGNFGDDIFKLKGDDSFVDYAVEEKSPQELEFAEKENRFNEFADIFGEEAVTFSAEERENAGKTDINRNFGELKRAMFEEKKHSEKTAEELEEESAALAKSMNEFYNDPDAMEEVERTAKLNGTKLYVDEEETARVEYGFDLREEDKKTKERINQKEKLLEKTMSNLSIRKTEEEWTRKDEDEAYRAAEEESDTERKLNHGYGRASSTSYGGASVSSGVSGGFSESHDRDAGRSSAAERHKKTEASMAHSRHIVNAGAAYGADERKRDSKRTKKPQKRPRFFKRSHVTAKTLWVDTLSLFKTKKARIIGKVATFISMQTMMGVMSNKYEFEGNGQMAMYITMMTGMFWISSELAHDGIDSRGMAIY